MLQASFALQYNRLAQLPLFADALAVMIKHTMSGPFSGSDLLHSDCAAP